MAEVLNLVHLPDGRVVNETNSDPAIPRITGFDRYWLSADLGQANDFTAIVGIRDKQLPIVDGGRIVLGPRERTIVYADRFRGVSYVDVVDHLIRLRNAKPFAGKTDLCVDASSLGRVVSDQLTDQNCPHLAIQMVAGQNWVRKGKYVNAAKSLIIESLSVMFASGDLTFAKDLPLRKEIEEDLASFQLTTTAAGNQIITQSRSASGHGDLGVSLAICAFASQYLKPQRIEVGQLRGYY